MQKISAFGVTLVLLIVLCSSLIFDNNLLAVNALNLFSKDFDITNNMTVISGVWNTSGGLLHGAAVNDEALAWTGDLSWMYYQATANIRQVKAGGEIGLIVRYTDPSNYYFFSLGGSGHKYSISKVVDGVSTELAFSGIYTEIEAGKWYIVTVLVVGDSLQLMVNGLKVLETTDYSHPNGAVGFEARQNTIQAGQLVVQSLGWSQTYGVANDEHAYSVIQTSDGGYVMGMGTWFVKTDSAGNVDWNRTLRGNNALSVIQTLDGGYALAGTNMSDPPPGVIPNLDFCLVKTDSNGNEQWRKTYGGYSNQYANSVFQTSDGGYAIVGTSYAFGPGTAWFVKTDSNGNMEWNKTYGLMEYTDCNSVIQTYDGGYALAGTITQPLGNITTGSWLVKTDRTGNAQWNKTYGETSTDKAYDVIQTFDGGYALVATKYNIVTKENDARLIKTSSIGNVEWSKTFGGAKNDEIRSLIQTIDGGYALTGFTSSSGAGGSDGWFIKIDSNGNIQYNRTFGGINDDAFRSLVEASDGGYAIAGSTESSPKGKSNAWFLKVAQDSPPETLHNYDDIWHTADFPIGLFAIDDFTAASQIYYRLNDGAVKTVSANGQPLINVEVANNKLEYWSVDTLGHEDVSHKVLAGIKLDKIAPTCSIVIDNGAVSTSSISAVLTLSATDSLSGVSQVRYSNDGVWDTEVWENFSTTKQWTLTSDDGIKTVYYQAKDVAGLPSLTYSDAIILEKGPVPTPTSLPTSNPTSTPRLTTTPTTTTSPSQTSSPTAQPSQTITIYLPTLTPMASPNAIFTATPAPSTTYDSTYPSKAPNQTISVSPSPVAQPIETTIYLYVAVVLAIFAISIGIIILMVRRRQ